MKISWEISWVVCVLVAAVFLLATPAAFAQEQAAAATTAEVLEVELPTPEVNPGITPDSPLYGLDVAFDQISLWISSFSGPRAHALKGLEIAQERLAEANVMATAKKFAAMAKAKEEHGKVLAIARGKIKDIADPNGTVEIEQRLGVEKSLLKHTERIERFKAQLNAKVEIEGNVTTEQQALINATLNDLVGQVDAVEIEIKNEEAKTKIKIRQQTNKTDEEIENETEEIEDEMGLVDMAERAVEQIDDATEAVAEAKATAESLNITQSGVLTLLENAEKHLEKAQTAFAEEKYGEAFGQATAAEHIAEAAGKLAGKITEVKEKIAEKAADIAAKQAELEEKIAEKRAEIEEKIAEKLNKTAEEIAEERAEIEEEIAERLNTTREQLKEKLRERLKEIEEEGEEEGTER